MSYNVPLLRPYFDDDELQEVKSVLESGWVAQGPKSVEFQEASSKYLHVKHTIPVSNCTAALHLAQLAHGIGPGDEVLVGDYTYPATGHSVLYTGARPVFIDIDPDTFNMDPALIEENITERTKAIIPVHTFGQPVDMDDILKIARDNDLAVIEDAACAFGAEYHAQKAGTMGDVGCFSLHARKGITTGEGGLIATNDDDLANRMRKLAVFGITQAWEREGKEGFFIPEFTQMGYNYKMSDITAAVGVAQLRKVERIISRKLERAHYWNEKLEELELVSPPVVAPDRRHVYQTYVALIDKRIDRNELIMNLSKRGVQCQIGTYASHIQPVYQSKNKCPVSLDIFNRALALPLFYSLSENDIDFAAEELKKAIEELK
ncbi:MAG: DegT/DnrJ/EryC1/StrS family aminotransferase [Methanosarcinaceae archaeon]